MAGCGLALVPSTCSRMYFFRVPADKEALIKVMNTITYTARSFAKQQMAVLLLDEGLGKKPHASLFTEEPWCGVSLRSGY